MQKRYTLAGLASLALALAISLTAVAQTSTTSNPPPQAPAQSQAGSAGNTSQDRAQPQQEEDNPLNLTDEQKQKLRPIIANETQFYCGPLAGMVPFIEAGSVRALAVSGERRSPFLPDVPTMREAGIPAYKAIGWFGLLAPAGTPQAIIRKLSDGVRDSVNSADAIAGLRAQGIEPATSSPAEFASFIREQLELHKKLAEEIDLKLSQ